MLGAVLALVALGCHAATPAAAPELAGLDEDIGTMAPPVQLAAAFPPLIHPLDNPSSPQKVELGRQLFYDPVLSTSGTISCATCHHPDLGFSNGAPTSTPRPGALPRNVSTLWNTAYNRFLLWDGRETSLESHARLPLTLPNEMDSQPQEVEVRLRAIDAYVDLFDAAFGDAEEGVTFENVTKALASFQRTLVSTNSVYDRFAAGDQDALTAEQQRGMDLFFSEQTRCAECHQPPTFSSETFRVIGVDSVDPGRAGVSESGVFGAFKVPTLRNVALSAPYMHDGSLATLADVVDFYAQGAGAARGATVDPLLEGFTLAEEEKEDLIAFLKALTDESQLPPVPDVALSGLPVVPRLNNPARP